MTERFENAAGLEGLPSLERSQATEILGERTADIEIVTKGINNFVANPDAKWGFASPAIDKIKKYEDRKADDEQVVALLEAINETKDVNNDPVTIRRKVAQHAWVELHRSAEYSNLHFQADTEETSTTVDDLETEKQELIGALKDDLWSDEQIKEHRRLYRSMRAMIRDYYPDEIGEDLKVVWDSLRGKASRNTSAIDVLQSAESVLRDLDFEGAFEYEFEDFDEE